MEPKLKRLEDTVNAVIACGEPYEDAEFPPHQGSNGYMWMRASEINPNYVVLPMPSHITPDCLNQGALGDCYFLSCLSALAAQP